MASLATVVADVPFVVAVLLSMLLRAAAITLPLHPLDVGSTRTFLLFVGSLLS